MNRKLAEQYYRRADEHLRNGEPEEALLLLDTLDEAYPGDKHIMLARARTLSAMGRGAEAVALCDALIERFDYGRAKELKARLGPDGARAMVMTRGRSRVWRRLRIAAVAVAGVAAIGYAAFYVQRFSPEHAGPVTPTQADVEALAAERAAARRARAAERERALEAKAEAEVTELLTVHPREEWSLAAVDGMPQWEAGTYEDVPCINAPERTLDVFLPLAYKEKPGALFPAVIVQMPQPKPGFIGLRPWAESREVIVVVINSSTNRTFETNHIAQDHALETLADQLRVDRRLGFAIGMSGGGRSSWKMVCRYPEHFRGVVMMGIAGIYDCTLPPGVLVGYVHGDEEPNNPHIYKAIPLLQRRGHDVREIVVPGEHVMGPPSARIRMLEWMVKATREAFGLAHPEREVTELAKVMAAGA